LELEQNRRPKNISQDQGPNTSNVGWEAKTTTETEMEMEAKNKKISVLGASYAS